MSITKLTTKMLVSGAIALGASVGLAGPASADPVSYGSGPSPFQGLSCNCQATPPLTGVALTQEFSRGIQGALAR